MRLEPSDDEGRWSTTEADGSSYHLAGWSWKGQLLDRVKTWSLLSKSFWAALSWPWLRLRTGENATLKPLDPPTKFCVIILRMYLELQTYIIYWYKHELFVWNLFTHPICFPLPRLSFCAASRMESAEGTWKNTKVKFFISGSISQTWTHMVGDISKDPIFFSRLGNFIYSMVVFLKTAFSFSKTWEFLQFAVDLVLRVVSEG